MTISDVLTIIGIILAIIAFLSESDREFIYNKFSVFDKVVLIVFFLYINFLIFFDWWYKRIELLNGFSYKNFPTPNTWAYIISILLLFWLIYKIYKADFPKSKHNQLVLYYKKTLVHKKYIRLFNIIEKYHMNDILKFFSNNKDSLNSFIVEKVLSTKSFIKNTETLNYDFYSKIIEIDNKGIITNNYILTTIPITTAIINDYDIISNIIHKGLVNNYKNIDYLNLSKFFNSHLTILEKTTHLDNFLNFSILVSKTAIKNCDNFTKYILLIDMLIEIIINNKTPKDDLYKRIKLLVIESWKCRNHFEVIFKAFIKNLCYNKSITENDILDSLSLFIQMDSVVSDEILEIREQLIIEFCNNKNDKTLNKKIYNLYLSEHKNYKGNFKTNVIDIISNY